MSQATSIVIGIDTGKKGAFAVVEDGIVTSVKRMPDGLPVRAISALAFEKRLGTAGERNVEIFYEKPNGFMSKNASYWSGFYEASCLAIPLALVGGADIHCVQPKDWQREMFSSVKGRKDTKAAARAAITFFESRIEAQYTIKHDGEVDAILIALYGWRMLYRGPLVARDNMRRLDEDDDCGNPEDWE